MRLAHPAMLASQSSSQCPAACLEGEETKGPGRTQLWGHPEQCGCLEVFTAWLAKKKKWALLMPRDLGAKRAGNEMPGTPP